MRENILVIGAHPDDPDFVCGGTLAKKAREGAKITYVLVTKGERGSRERIISVAKLKKIRVREQEEAAKIIGVKEVVFLDYPDGELEPSFKLRKELTKIIRKYQPDIVYTHDPTCFYFNYRHMVNHPDHRAVGEAALAAIFPAARDRLYFPQHLKEGLGVHRVEKIFLFNSEPWDYWEDISSTIEVKIEALLKHESQLEDPEAKIKRIKKFARFFGKKKGIRYAEVFKFLNLKNKEVAIPG